MIDLYTNLSAARAILVLQGAVLKDAAQFLERGNAVLVTALTDVHRHTVITNATDEAFAETLAEAIAEGRDPPSDLNDVEAHQARRDAERQARIAAIAVARLKARYEAAEEVYTKALADVKAAVDQVLDAQARALLAEIDSHEKAIEALASDLSAFVVEGWRDGTEPLSCNFEIAALFDKLTTAHEVTSNNIHTPVSELQRPVRRAPVMRRESRLTEMRRELIDAAPATATEEPRAA